tara:strand:+ start:97 stop:1125 length:1029 start_codon:yes stop_codon:yes gene_type:complete
MFGPIAISIFEIPTGIFADKFGRKINFIISGFISSIGFLIYAFSSNVWHAAIAESLYSIGLAFQTGSLDALLISQAKEFNFSTSKILSKHHVYKISGIVIGGTLGIILSFNNMRLPWLFGAFGFPIVGLIAMLIDGSSQKITKNFSSLLKGLRNYFNNNKVIYLSILNMGITLVNIPFFNYWQIFMEVSLGVERRSIQFIIIFILYNILMILGSLLAPYFAKKLGNINNLFIFSVLVAVPSITFVLTKNFWIAIFSFLISEFARGVFLPSFFFIFNKNIEEKGRSIYLSQLSMITRLFSILAHLTSSIVAKHTNDIELNIYILSLVGLAMSLTSLIAMKRKQ